MVADLTTKKNRSDAFSLLYLGFNIGFTVGPLLAGFLIVNHLSLIFLIDGITTILATIPILIFIKDTLPSKKKITVFDASEDEKPEVGNTLKIFLKKPLLVGLALISIIYSFIYAQTNFSLPLYLNEIFSQNGPKFYGMLMSINAVVVVVTTLFIIAFFRRFKPTINIAIAGILFAIGFGLLYFSKFLYLFIISAFIWTFGEIINAVSSNVLIANYSPMSHRGRFNAIITFIGGIGFSLSPLLIGIFIRYNDLQSVWLLMFILACAGALLMFAFYFFIARKIKADSDT
jgi:MFS family permease